MSKINAIAFRFEELYKYAARVSSDRPFMLPVPEAWQPLTFKGIFVRSVMNNQRRAGPLRVVSSCVPWLSVRKRTIPMVGEF
jgi:hypothetical protein